MPKVLIISPDPESRRILQLAIELGGMETETAVDAFGAPAADCVAVLADMVDDSESQWDAARRALALKSAGKSPPVALILPRGRTPARLPRGIEKAGLLVKRPYELLVLVGMMKELTDKPEKKRRPPVEARDPRKPAVKPKGSTTPRKSSSSRKKAHRAS